MELKDFIEQSVSDIADATHRLMKKYNHHKRDRNNVIAAYKDSSLERNKHSIDFDIAVTVSKRNNEKRGAKWGVYILNANMKDENECENEKINHIKFSIPFYPENLTDDTYKE